MGEKMGMLAEMKQDITDSAVDAILDDKKTQQMLEVANPFIKPALKSLLKELGYDEGRLSVFIDKATGELCFYKVKTENLNIFQKGEKEVVNPFTQPLLQGLSKELGNDDYQMLIMKDTNNGDLCFIKIKTDKIKNIEVEDGGIDKSKNFRVNAQEISSPIQKKEIFRINPQEIEKGNVKDVVKAIIKKLGVKLM